MDCEGFSPEVYGFYTLGTLDGAERDALSDHLRRNCTHCASELALSRKIWQGVAQAAPDVEPRGILRQRIIASVGEAPVSGWRFAWWQPVAGLAAILLATLAGTLLNRPAAPIAVLAPSSGGPALTALVRENEALRQRLISAKASEGTPSSASSKATPAVPLPANSTLAAKLEEERRRAAQAEKEVADQKNLLAAASRAAEEANSKYLAMLSQPSNQTPGPVKPDLQDAQRQLAAAQLRTQQLEHDVAEYRALLATARQQVTASRRAAESAALLSDPNLRLVRLRATHNAFLEGHALVSSGSQVIFYGSQLPALAAGRTYQLWLIRSNSPAIVSAGTFQPNSARKATIEFGSATLTSGITAVAVTDEPEGGSITPTGPKLLIGS